MRFGFLPLLLLAASAIGLEVGSTRQKQKDLTELRSLARGRQQAASVSCTFNTDCAIDELCMAGSCVDPCSLPPACGRNALCTVSNHFASCKCPECYTGNPHMECEQELQCTTTK